ncbi:unnamed protein product [Blepharisma stoltei]|uniref:Protein kinase domain-containing protein n=1 Tax=Blepharisma stoltei TaxID=1481888 RepID=A0AAU9IT29_9CILI|nr:unnamed protein product [Blepharisma stoltei]
MSQDILIKDISTEKEFDQTFTPELSFGDERTKPMSPLSCFKCSLSKLIRKQQKLTEYNAWQYFSQICIDLKYMHDNKIIHMDIKPENIFIDQSNIAKICDLGWSVKNDEVRLSFCAALDYMAPETLKDQEHSLEADLWAMGVLLYEMLHGYSPFEAEKDSEKYLQVCNPSITFDPSVSIEAFNLIKGLIKPDPEKRSTLNQVLSHPFLGKFDTDRKYEIGQKVYSKLFGHGIIEEIEGLLVTVFYSGENVLEYLSIPEVSSKLKVYQKKEISHLEKRMDKTIQYEKHIFEKIEKYIHTPKHSFIMQKSRKSSRRDTDIEDEEILKMLCKHKTKNLSNLSIPPPQQKKYLNDSSQEFLFCEETDNPAAGLFENEQEINSIIEARKRKLKQIEIVSERCTIEAPRYTSVRKAPYLSPQSTKNSFDGSTRAVSERDEETKSPMSTELIPSSYQPITEILYKRRHVRKAGFGRWLGDILGCVERATY